jgi:hypothetical protein
VKPPPLTVAPPTPQWSAFVKHVAGCRTCRTSDACEASKQLLREHLATRR